MNATNQEVDLEIINLDGDNLEVAPWQPTLEYTNPKIVVQNGT